MIKSCMIVVLCYTLSIVFDVMLPATSHLQFFKYILASFAMTLLAYSFFSKKIKKQNMIIAGIGIIFLVSYVILLLDTFYIHALTWFPGIVRYALFSAYLPISLLFFIPGICLCYLKK